MSEGAPRVIPTAMGLQLAETVRRLVDDAKSGDPLGRVTVVTPSFYSAFYLRRSLAPGGLFNVEFARLDEVAETLAIDSLRQRGSTSLTRLQASQLVHAAAMRTLDESTPLGRIREHDATQRALHRTFTEMSALDEGVLDRLPNDRHFRDLRNTFDAFREISGSFHDRRIVAELAADALNQRGHAIASQFGRLIVVFAETPPSQYRPLWEALARMPEVLVAVGLTGSPEADALVTRLFRGEVSASSDGAANLPKLFSAPSRTGEIKAVVRQVMAGAREGVRFGNMAVLFADPSYGPRLYDALELAGIPVCGPDPSTMAQTPQGRFIDGVFRIIEDDYSREAVTSWLTSSPIQDPATGSEVPAARWDATSRAAGITVGAGTWESRLHSYAASSESAPQFTEDDEPSAAESKARSSRADHARALAAFVNQLSQDLSAPVSSWEGAEKWLRFVLDRYLRRDESEASASRWEWLERLAGRIGSLGGTDGIEPPSLPRLASIVREELERPLRTSRSLGSGVFVGSLSDSVGCVFDAVHIVGMREGLFPPPDRVDPLLPDDVRERLDPDGLDLPGRRTRRAIDRRRFLAAIATSPDVFLYWPRSESGSVRESAPAPWFVEQARRHEDCEQVQAGDLLKGLCPAVVRIDDGEGAETLPTVAGDLFERDVATVAQWSRAGMAPSDLPLPLEEMPPIDRALALATGRGSPGWTRFDGNLSDVAGGFYAPPGPVSPTRFEKYAACPLRYFLGELASVEPTEKPENELVLSPLAQGSLVHRILEAFVKDRGPGVGGPLDAQQTRLLDIAQIEFRRFEQESATGHPAMWELIQRSIMRNLTRWLDAESGHLASGDWQTHLVEQEFGTTSQGSLAPVRIDLDDGRSIEFRGVIDRVDISTDEARAAVFDYKTGGVDGYKGLDKDAVLRGTKLQLAVYGAAIRQAYPSVQEIDSNYWFVFGDAGHQLIPGPGAYDEDIANERLHNVVDIVSQGIAGGAFPARPGGSSFSPRSGSTFKNCTYCEYDRICPAQRQRQWARKRGAPALARYVELTGDTEGAE